MSNTTTCGGGSILDPKCPNDPDFGDTSARASTSQHSSASLFFPPKKTYFPSRVFAVLLAFFFFEETGESIAFARFWVDFLSRYSLVGGAVVWAVTDLRGFYRLGSVLSCLFKEVKGVKEVKEGQQVKSIPLVKYSTLSFDVPIPVGTNLEYIGDHAKLGITSKSGIKVRVVSYAAVQKMEDAWIGFTIKFLLGDNEIRGMEPGFPPSLPTVGGHEARLRGYGRRQSGQKGCHHNLPPQQRRLIRVERFGFPFSNPGHDSHGWINENTPIAGGVSLQDFLAQRVSLFQGRHPLWTMICGR
ncbi:hypothetical protein QBC35DRAFT_535238 [Podospora australis]|uniref:Uncharacterized protein n=1 Tax=Podospora australis TaxID=1536484 RepID=A0AAN7AFN0_9PEZI|nr:hypothetical protein QBC35DRAFT_535238 [Podospora australis]